MSDKIFFWLIIASFIGFFATIFALGAQLRW